MEEDSLSKATVAAQQFAGGYKRKGVAGIFFMGALARGYFDKYADIDIVIVARKSSKLRFDYRLPIPKYEGFELDAWVGCLEDMKKKSWSMDRRWSFSEAKIYYDPYGELRRLLKEKCRYRKRERRWLIMEGTVQSEWFANRLPKVWVSRGDMLSAHAMFGYGVSYLLQAVFAINKRLIPYKKWDLNYSRKLPWLPDRFHEKLGEIYTMRDLTREEIDRRRRAFMYIWGPVRKRAEKEIGIKFEVFKRFV
jgi:predicted nucleotidyltransferase